MRGPRQLAARLALLGSLAALLPAAGASAHAIVSPEVSLSGHLQLYTLAVPTEKAGASTTGVALTVPSGFAIDSFVPPPTGFAEHVSRTGSGGSAVVTRVVWTGGRVPTGDDAVFSFLAEPAAAGTYTFGVEQTYSDGSIVNWTGAPGSQDPAPTITATSSLGGGGGGTGSTTLTILAFVVGVLGLLAAGAALVLRGGRELG